MTSGVKNLWWKSQVGHSPGFVFPVRHCGFIQSVKWRVAVLAEDYDMARLKWLRVSWERKPGPIRHMDGYNWVGVVIV